MSKHLSKNIIWLASYPKSGNTWFRAFLSALLNNGNLDINDLKTDGIFSSRVIFDNVTGLDSTLFYDEEINNMMPEVIEEYSCSKDKKCFIKIHNAFTYNKKKKPIVPQSVSLGVIYLVRNPLDIVASLANHLDYSLENTVGLMNNSDSYFLLQEGNCNIYSQFPQLVSDWSNHVNSWISQNEIPVFLIRYEDLLERPEYFFEQAVSFMELNYTSNEIKKAFDAAEFSKLKEQEQQKGFNERSLISKKFFRTGKINNWSTELNPELIQSIIDTHKLTMHKLNYSN